MTLDTYALLIAVGFIGIGVLSLFGLALLLVIICPEKKGAKRCKR